MAVTLTIDGRAFQVEAGDNLLHACLSLGFNLPYFCWHPALGSVGACRQCAVKQFRDAGDHAGRLVMACMTPVADGMHLSIEDGEAKSFRASVIEWLMTNHPHDCPVCPEGGECHLQDITVMTGHVRRRYRFHKRTFRNQYLGPFVAHEMNRCIACYRCVRFYRDYAGGQDFDVFASHRYVYFGRAEDGRLENEFSGNLVEICPTGVFTDKPLGRLYARKWDMAGAPSVCVHCGLGCNVTVNARAGHLRRLLNRYHHQINGYFLCDRGRFGHGFADLPERIRQPLRQSHPLTRDATLRHLAGILPAAKPIGIGSPRASLEANFALRQLVGPDRFHLGLAAEEQRLLSLIIDILQKGPAPAATLADAEQADAVLVLGEDLPNTAPRLALALRQATRRQAFAIAGRLGIPSWLDNAVRDAAQQEKSPLFIATLDATRLDNLATAVFRLPDMEVARLGYAIAQAIDDDAPKVSDGSAEFLSQAQVVAQALAEAQRPLIVAGTSSGSRAVIEAAANLAWALCRRGRAAQLSMVVPECDSLGLALMGGGNLAEAFAAVDAGAVDTFIVLENDLYRRAERSAVDACLNRLRHLLVIDHSSHQTAARAEIFLPAADFAESDGTLVNNEGRAQRFFSVRPPSGGIQESWRWLRDMAAVRHEGEPLPWRQLDDVTAACAKALPGLSDITNAAPGAGFRIAGAKIPRQPQRYSGRTALHADRTMHEPKPAEDPDTPLAYSMEGAATKPPPSLIPFVWAPAWNSVQAINKFQQEVGGPLRGGPAGSLLIHRSRQARRTYLGEVPRPFAPRRGRWWIEPLYAIFGSEELSRMSAPIAEILTSPTVALPPADAARLGITEGALVELRLGGEIRRMPATLHPALPPGTGGLLAGTPESIGLILPGWGEIKACEGTP